MHDGPMTDVNTYEAERENRIRENKEKLLSLGIAPLKIAPRTFPKTRRLQRIKLAATSTRELRPRSTAKVSYKESPLYRKNSVRKSNMKDDIFSSQEEDPTLAEFMKKNMKWPTSTATMQSQFDIVVAKLEGTDRPEENLTIFTPQDLVDTEWDDLEKFLESRGLDFMSK
jgi:hypothetical protein